MRIYLLRVLCLSFVFILMSFFSDVAFAIKGNPGGQEINDGGTGFDSDRGTDFVGGGRGVSAASTGRGGTMGGGFGDNLDFGVPPDTGGSGLEGESSTSSALTIPINGSGFSDVSGLEPETSSVEYRNGSEGGSPNKMPSIPKYSDINVPNPSGGVVEGEGVKNDIVLIENSEPGMNLTPPKINFPSPRQTNSSTIMPVDNESANVVTVNPPGGTVSGPGIVLDGGDTPFIPSGTAPVGPTKINYTVDGKTSTVTILNKGQETSQVNPSKGSFSEGSGLEMETNQIEYREGSESGTKSKQPGIPKYSNVTLKHGTFSEGGNSIREAFSGSESN